MTQISVVDVVGYGVAAQGSEQFLDGNKRDGQNRYEVFFDAAQTMITYDFDSGNAANDANGIGFGVNNTGLGNQEVLAVGGDSGSPTFLNGVIAGVHSFRTTLVGGVGDAIAGINGSVGEISVDGLTSANANFIDGIITNQTGAPRVTEVLLNGSTWARDPYSFTDLALAGDQYAPIFTQGVDEIQVVFSEHVYLDALDNMAMGIHSDFELVGSNGTIPFDGFSYNGITNTATWTFNTPLAADKYALVQVGAVTDVGNVGASLNPLALDAEWDEPIELNDVTTNPDGPQAGTTFAPGNGSEGGEFRLHFAYSPGDYDQDGYVEANPAGYNDDLAVIQDGDGDGVIESGVGQDDYNIAVAANGTALVASTAFGGDYNDNEIVDAMADIGDYRMWADTYATPVPPGTGADGNNDGFINAADYVVWRNNMGNISAWSANFGMAAVTSGVPIVNFGTPPQVVNVTIDGSPSVHDPFSFDTVDGSGAQLVRVPVGGANMISVTFSEDVNISLLDDLSIVGLTTGQLSGDSGWYSTYSSSTQTATWYYPNILPNDQYLISLSDNITDVEGNRLDGEWVNPASIYTSSTAGVSTFPSGDGNAGGSFNFVFTLLTDPSGDNLVTSIDEYYLYYQAGFFDLNGDGYVTGADYDLIDENMGIDLRNVWILADLNGDYAVDDLDLEIVYDNWISNLPNPTWADGDLNGDGDIGLDDFELLFSQFGLELSVVA